MKQILILLFLLLSLNAYSQEEADSTDARLLSDITYKAELSATALAPQQPLWPTFRKNQLRLSARRAVPRRLGRLPPPLALWLWAGRGRCRRPHFTPDYPAGLL